VRIGTGRDPLADVRMRNRVERLVDGRELIAPDFRITPERNVIRCGGRRQQQTLLLGLKVFERPPLRATVPPEAVVIAAPVAAPRARLIERGEDFASKAVVPHAWYGPLDAPFVARLPDAGRVDMKVARLRILEKRRRDPRREGIGLDDDRLGVIRNEDLENAAEKLPRRFTRLDRTGGGLLEGRIDKAMA
jgi:hypothetical protein